MLKLKVTTDQGEPLYHHLEKSDLLTIVEDWCANAQEGSIIKMELVNMTVEEWNELVSACSHL